MRGARLPRIMSKKQDTTTEIPAGRWREPQARRVLRRWQESGLAAAAFARVNGLNPQRLLWWRKRLEESGEGAEAPMSFIPGEVAGGAAATIVRLPGGVALELADAAVVPTAWIAALARELKGQS